MVGDNVMRWMVRGAGLPALAVLAGAAFGGDPPAPPVDRPKAVIEGPVKAAVKNSTAPAAQMPPPPRLDAGKMTIELPTKAVVARESAEAPSNPRVQPGLVRWHATFEAACAAARKSGKPVLLFQMMGKLDEQFC